MSYVTDSVTDGEGNSMHFTIGLPAVIIFLTLLLVFAIVILLLTIVIVRHRRKERSQPTAIPKILERRAIARNAYDPKNRPKSTNLEFLHSTNEGRYNNTNNDIECFKPLVESNHNGNEYVQC